MEKFYVSIIGGNENIPTVIFVVLVSDVNEGSENELGGKILELLNSGGRHFALEMNGFRFLGSSIFSLVETLNEITSKDGSLTLIGLSTEDTERLRNAKLSQMFRQCSSLEEYCTSQLKVK